MNADADAALRIAHATRGGDDLRIDWSVVAEVLSCRGLDGAEREHALEKVAVADLEVRRLLMAKRNEAMEVERKRAAAKAGPSGRRPIGAGTGLRRR